MGEVRGDDHGSVRETQRRFDYLGDGFVVRVSHSDRDDRERFFQVTLHERQVHLDRVLLRVSLGERANLRQHLKGFRDFRVNRDVTERSLDSVGANQCHSSYRNPVRWPQNHDPFGLRIQGSVGLGCSGARVDVAGVRSHHNGGNKTRVGRGRQQRVNLGRQDTGVCRVEHAGNSRAVDSRHWGSFSRFPRVSKAVSLRLRQASFQVSAAALRRPGGRPPCRL